MSVPDNVYRFEDWEREPADVAAEDRFEYLVQIEQEKIAAREEAVRRRRALRSEQIVIDPFIPLREFLSVQDDPVRFVIEGLLPVGGRVVLAAQYKAGKTTLLGNLARSLADGEPFLGQFSVHGPRRLGLIDNELDQRTFRVWMREYGIRHEEQIEVKPLRGKARTFDILDDDIRRQWVERLAGFDAIGFDCLRPVLDALGLNENTEAGRFLEAFDALMVEAGISEAVIVHHMGHSAERSRGDSRILDWPDATWNLLRVDPDDPASARFFRAFGRDVDVAEGALEYNAVSRALSYTTGATRRATRTAEKVTAARDIVLGYIQANPGCSGEDLQRADALKSYRNEIVGARDSLTTDGLITRTKRTGRGGGFIYHPSTRKDLP